MVRPFIMHIPDSIQETRLLSSVAAYKLHEYEHTSINHCWTSEETLHLLFNTSRQAILLQGGIHSCGSDVQMIYTCVFVDTRVL